MGIFFKQSRPTTMQASIIIIFLLLSTILSVAIPPPDQNIINHNTLTTCIQEECEASNLRVSITSAGEQLIREYFEEGSYYYPSRRSEDSTITPDGRFVVFTSNADNLPGHSYLWNCSPPLEHLVCDKWNVKQVFVHDRDYDEDGIYDEQGENEIRTVLISKNHETGEPADGDCGGFFPQNPVCNNDWWNGNSKNRIPVSCCDQVISISENGKIIVFTSFAINLDSTVEYDEDPIYHVYLHDRDVSNDGVFDEEGDISTVMIDQHDGEPYSLGASDPTMSANGRYIAYQYTNPTLYKKRIDLLDTQSHIKTVVPVPEEDVHIKEPSLSGDGTYLVFETYDGDDPHKVYVWDHINEDNPEFIVYGHVGDAPEHLYPKISASGRYILFQSFRHDLVDDDQNDARDVFLYDRNLDIFSRVSVTTSGEEGGWCQHSGGGYDGEFGISPDESFIVFSSRADLVDDEDLDCTQKVFLHNLQTGETTLVSRAYDGSQPEENYSINEPKSGWPSVSNNAEYIAYSSNANNIIEDDTNEIPDVFVRCRCIQCICEIIGDLNNDGLVTFDDIAAFVKALAGEQTFYEHYPQSCWWCADINQDGSVDFDDIASFVDILGE